MADASDDIAVVDGVEEDDDDDGRRELRQAAGPCECRPHPEEQGEEVARFAAKRRACEGPFGSARALGPTSASRRRASSLEEDPATEEARAEGELLRLPCGPFEHGLENANAAVRTEHLEADAARVTA